MAASPPPPPSTAPSLFENLRAALPDEFDEAAFFDWATKQEAWDWQKSFKLTAEELARGIKAPTLPSDPAAPVVADEERLHQQVGAVDVSLRLTLPLRAVFFDSLRVFLDRADLASNWIRFALFIYGSRHGQLPGVMSPRILRLMAAKVRTGVLAALAERPVGETRELVVVVTHGVPAGHPVALLVEYVYTALVHSLAQVISPT